MNEMYNMGIVTHNLGVIALFGVIFINFLMLYAIKDLRKYVRVLSLFTPILSVGIGTVFFTGVVMMAAKHLEFSVQNVAMIVAAVLFIYLEIKRLMRLKYLDKKVQNIFTSYRDFASKILAVEFFVTLFIALWMWL
jgi:hypothetical protein